MGNRAHVVFASEDNTEISPAVYLHWNGGPESVYPFLKELDRRQCRGDQEYETARFIAIAAQLFDGTKYTTLSLGVVNGPNTITTKALEPLNHGDNGVYVVYRGNGKLRVRRFVGYGAEFKEMSAAAVKREEKAAWENSYNTGDEVLSDVFTKDDKPIEDCH